MIHMGDSPAPIAKCESERIGLGRLARLRDQTLRVEHHGVLVDFGVVHEVPACSREQQRMHYIASARVLTKCLP